MAERATPEGVPERLVRGTIGLLAEQGPSAIKARTVASASGLSTMVVYHHFGGIPELIRAVVDHGFKELEQAFSQVPVTEDPVADLFVHGIDVPAGRPREPSPLRPDVRTVHSRHLPTAVGFGRSVEWTFAGLP